MTEKLEEKNQPISSNYKTVEVKTEEEIERDRLAYVEQVEAENKEKAINAKAKRNKNDLIFIRTVIIIIAIIVGILLVRYFMY